MMREIEFRGKSFDSGKWLYGGLCKSKMSIFFIIEHFGTFECVKPETVGEFTGFYDKNGNKIFEDDLIQNTENGKIYRVKWENIAWIATDFANKNYIYGWRLFDLLINGRFKVVGNIFDSPEILNADYQKSLEV